MCGAGRQHLLQSYKKRAQELCFLDGPTAEAAIASRMAWAEWQFNQWCGPALSLDIASLGGKVQNSLPSARLTVDSAPQPKLSAPEASQSSLPTRRVAHVVASIPLFNWRLNLHF